jgi:hypothetical protein
MVRCENGAKQVFRGAPLTRLVTALRLHSDPPSTGLCPSVLMQIVPIVLIDARGRTLSPRPPVGPCGAPSDEVEAALAGLTDVHASG